MKISRGNLQHVDVSQEKSKKISRVVLVAIIITIIAIIGIIYAIIYLQSNTFRIYINNKVVNLPNETIIIDEISGKIHVDIIGIASYLGYDYHKGEFKIYTEDENKCWVENKNETASFFLNSNRISKVVPNQTKDYENYTISDPVISKNGKLYCTPEGIKIGFNVLFEYNKEQKNIQIFTLPYLVNRYEAKFRELGYKDGIDDSFDNQKAVLYNLFVVKKDNNLFGVVNSNNEEIIGSRYKNMLFNENAREFYVTSSINKKGIVTEEGETKINLLYDDIRMVDKQNQLYLVKNNNKFGMIGNTGNIIIHLEYDQIGVNVGTFRNNNINNQYVLFENAIPVYQNKKWGMFDINGNIILPLEYDTIGYSSGVSGKVVNNLLIVPSYKGIVFGKDYLIPDGRSTRKVRYYGIYDNKGTELIPTALTNAYFVVNAGVNTYYMEHKGQTLNIEEYLAEHVGNNVQNNTTDNNQAQSGVGDNTIGI